MNFLRRSSSAAEAKRTRSPGTAAAPPQDETKPNQVGHSEASSGRLWWGRSSIEGPDDPRIMAHDLPDGTLCLVLSGDWSLAVGIPRLDFLVRRLNAAPTVASVRLDGAGVTDWSSSLVTFVRNVQGLAGQHGLAVDIDGLPPGVQRMLLLANRRSARESRNGSLGGPMLAQLGHMAIAFAATVNNFTGFLGEVILAAGRALVGRAQFRGREFWQLIEDSGPRSLPIVMLISFLSGVIFAFVGATQLKWFGAELYVANLVTMGMAKEMAPLMTAMIMTGRTGAAYAAELGTMQVNEEIDAFRTMGIGPVDFLVLPRVLALSLMMPLLALFANMLGIAGGSVVGNTMLDISFLEFFVQAQQWIRLTDFAGGLFKAWVFGILIALAGCYYGMHCGRHSAAVGEATTATVVTSVVLVVIADALLTVIYTLLRGY